MPTYEYRCPDGHEFEDFVLKISAAKTELPCPTCGAVAARRMSAGSGLLFKGSGFYITDYGKDGKKDQRAAAAKSEGKGESSGKSDSSSSTGTGSSSGSGSGGGDAKPATKSAEASAAKSDAKPGASAPSTSASKSPKSGSSE